MEDQGIWWIAAGLLLSLAVAFLLRTRLHAWVVAGLLAVGGAALTLGVLLLQPNPSPVEIAVALPVMAAMVPVHVRVVLGRFGPR